MMAAWMLPVVHPLVGGSLAFAAFGVLYLDVLRGLWHDWVTDDNYSHGFLIVPIALYLIWERRHRLRAAPAAPNAAGLLLVAVSLAVLVLSVLGAERFLSRMSMIGVLAGGILYVWGWAHLRIVAFPLAFSLLMIPIPAILFNQIAFPLQLLASQTGQVGLRAMHIPVLREGNIIVLASTTLEVAEACSGIRSLVSLLTLGIVFGYLADRRNWMRVLLAVATVPIAVLSNGVRVAGIGLTASLYGADAALGFMHTFSGWIIFLLAFFILLVTHAVLSAVWPDRAATPSVNLGKDWHAAKA